MLWQKEVSALAEKRITPRSMNGPILPVHSSYLFVYITIIMKGMK
jgi:hypothetical protein